MPIQDRGPTRRWQTNINKLTKLIARIIIISTWVLKRESRIETMSGFSGLNGIRLSPFGWLFMYATAHHYDTFSVCVISSSIYFYFKFAKCFSKLFLSYISYIYRRVKVGASWYNTFTWPCVRLLQEVSVCIVDINECTVGTHNCHADSNCSNTKGSFYCTCLTGYSGDGVGCVGMCGNFSFIIILWKQLFGI